MKLSAKFIIFTAILISFSAGCQDDFSDVRENITGTWRCQEESITFEVQYYDVEIRKDPNDEQRIIVYNFFDKKQDVSIEIDGNALTIPLQEIDGWEILGIGEISSDFSQISWQFTADDGNGPEDFEALFVEKSPVALFFLTKN